MQKNKNFYIQELYKAYERLKSREEGANHWPY
ncbi:Uncharacterised protein [Helicobacter cholecystus]|nr:Uncharacterised protein [Helicobacter cholecystus]